MNRPVIQAFGLSERVFDVLLQGARVNDPVTFKRLEIRGGNPITSGDLNGGGIKSVGAKLEVADCIIADCAVSGDGGGIFASAPTATSVTISDNTKIEHNTALGNGGGVAISGATLTIKSAVKITGNEAGLGGGGLYVVGSNSIHLDGDGGLLSIDHNTAYDGDGGGVLVVNGGAAAGAIVDLRETTITSNIAYRDGLSHGGGIAVFGAYKVDSDTNTTISNNGEDELPPATAPFAWGVYLDPAVLGTSTLPANAVLVGNYRN